MSTQYLYDSSGKYIAFKIGNRLYNVQGKNIGYFPDEERAFDIQGKYLGHIVRDRRLLSKRGYNPGNIGSRGSTGSVGSRGIHGSISSIGIISGYEDVKRERLEK